jgi:hypothetical protein
MRLRRRKPLVPAPPPVARSECAENRGDVSTYRYRTASELASEVADREGLVGVEREQFIRDFLDAEYEHQLAGWEEQQRREREDGVPW